LSAKNAKDKAEDRCLDKRTTKKDDKWNQANIFAQQITNRTQKRKQIECQRIETNWAIRNMQR